jgi:hypothetical protein
MVTGTVAPVFFLKKFVTAAVPGGRKPVLKSDPVVHALELASITE